MYYSFRVMDICNFQIDLQSQIWPRRSKIKNQKVAYLTKRLCIEEIVLIHIIVSKQWTFEMFNLASEDKFDLGGQRFLV